MTYAEKLLDPRWQKKRLEILERDEWKCAYCGDSNNTLHVHHEAYVGEYPWETPNYCLITLCGMCHSTFHSLNELEKTLYKCILYRERNNPENFDTIQRLNRIIKSFKDNPNEKCCI
jgi:hypothetical protein